MSTSHICNYHAERMKACESEAFRYWLEMMRRGAQAYSECRMDAAHIYLSSALEIAFIRNDCGKNGIFSSQHLTKPSEFLLQMLILEQKFDQANSLLISISDASKTSDPNIVSFLSKHFQYIEKSEKNYLSNNDSSKHYWSFETAAQSQYH